MNNFDIVAAIESGDVKGVSTFFDWKNIFQSGTLTFSERSMDNLYEVTPFVEYFDDLQDENVRVFIPTRKPGSSETKAHYRKRVSRFLASMRGLEVAYLNDEHELIEALYAREKEIA